MLGGLEPAEVELAPGHTAGRARRFEPPAAVHEQDLRLVQLGLL